MKKLLITLFSALMFMTSAARADIDASKAENFIKNVTTQGIEELINTNVSEAEKKARFTKLFNEDLDLDYI